MRKNWKNGIALAVALCIAVGLMLPLAGTADAATYEFPEYGPTTLLGEHISAGISVREFIDHCSYGGKDYMLVPAYGGTLYIFSLSDYLAAGGGDGEWIYDSVDTGYSIPTGIDTSSDGKVYVIGEGATVKIYTFGVSGQVGSYTLPDSVSIGAVSVDAYNNVFLSAYGSDTAYLYRLTPDTSETSGYSCTTLFTVSGVAGVSAMVSGDRATDDYVYAQVGLDDGSSVIYKIHYTDGGSTQSYATTNGGLYYLSYADGKLFGGHSTPVSEGLIIVDTATMESTSITVKKDGETITENLGYFNGVVSEASAAGKCYMNITGVGLCQYDPDTDTATWVRKATSCVRDRGVYNYNGTDCLLSMSSNGAAYMFSVDGSSVPSVSAITQDATSNWTQRIMAAGATVDGEPVGPAAYVGGYLTPRVAGFDPDAEEPLSHTVFSQGHAQTDSMISYNGKIYAGCYTGGYLVEYDPSTGEMRDLIPGGLNKDYYQYRIHALAAGDNKIFFSTVPGTYTEGGDSGLGGCIGWYDLSTDELYCVRNVVQDQILVTLAYDEETNILYGGSSVLGGSNSTATQTEAYVMVYDVENKSLLGNFSIRYQGNTNSDLGYTEDVSWYDKYINQSSFYNLYKLHETPPRCISGLSIAPDGKMWGTFYNIVFSFSYDKSANTLTVKNEWNNGKTTSDPYKNSSSYSWFPRYFYFDDNGYMYVVPRQGGLYRLNCSDPSSGAVQIDANCGRSYTMGTDGNLYYAGTYDLYRISLNRVSITEDLIYAADLADQTSVDTAVAAFDALTETEQEQLGVYYQRKLATLGGYECIVTVSGESVYSTLADAMTNADSNTTVSLLSDCAGEVTVQKNITLDLNGNTLTGNVSVVNGTVVDSTNGTGGIVGALSLATDNPQLPLLNDGTYHLFNYTAEVRTAARDSENPEQVNYWFDLIFTNPTAYNYLAGSETSNLTVYAELYVDGRKYDETVSFDAKIKEWAAEDHTGEDDWALYVGVTNIPESVSEVRIVPVFSASGLSGSFGELTKDVSVVKWAATYGVWPTALVK